MNTHFPWAMRSHKLGHHANKGHVHGTVANATRVVLLLRDVHGALPSQYNWLHAAANRLQGQLLTQDTLQQHLSHKLQADEQAWVKYRDVHTLRETQAWANHTSCVQRAAHAVPAHAVASACHARARMHAAVARAICIQPPRARRRTCIFASAWLAWGSRLWACGGLVVDLGSCGGTHSAVCLSHPAPRARGGLGLVRQRACVQLIAPWL